MSKLFIPAVSIERTIHAALVREFGPRADLSEQTLADIEDVITSALQDAGRGGWEECNEQAVRIAARIESCRLSS